MKPDIDLNNPKVKEAMLLHQIQMEKALKVPQHVENAVVPIYFPLKSGSRSEQIGTGVVVRIKDEYFIFSASHVFEEIGAHRLLIGTGDGSKLLSLSGDRFSRSKGPSGTHKDDPIDASVFHIQSNISPKMKEIAITINDFDLSQDDNSRAVFMAAGFRTKKSNTAGKKAKSNRECFPSLEYSEKDYSILNIDSNYHIAIAYENQMLIDGNWNLSPKPTGISGGAIIKIEGINLFPPFGLEKKTKQLLTAITIEQRREKPGKPGALIGTRVGVHLGLIDNYLPNILDDLL